MIMKRLLLICICILSCIFCFTKEVHIKLTKNDRMADTRSSSAIHITQDNNIIYIYTDSPIQNIKITVKDETGNLIYSEYLTNIYNRYPILINNTENGFYTIYLTINDTSEYYGTFYIDE
jgi:hypothetical protein